MNSAGIVLDEQYFVNSTLNAKNPPTLNLALIPCKLENRFRVKITLLIVHLLQEDVRVYKEAGSLDI